MNLVPFRETMGLMMVNAPAPDEIAKEARS